MKVATGDLTVLKIVRQHEYFKSFSKEFGRSEEDLFQWKYWMCEPLIKVKFIRKGTG